MKETNHSSEVVTADVAPTPTSTQPAQSVERQLDPPVVILVALMELERSGQLKPEAQRRVDRGAAVARRYVGSYLCLCGGRKEPGAHGSESEAAERYLLEHDPALLQTTTLLKEKGSQNTQENVEYARGVIERLFGTTKLVRVIAVSSSRHLRFFELVRRVLHDDRYLITTEECIEPPQYQADLGLTKDYQELVKDELRGMRNLRRAVRLAHRREEAPLIYRYLIGDPPVDSNLHQPFPDGVLQLSLHTLLELSKLRPTTSSSNPPLNKEQRHLLDDVAKLLGFSVKGDLYICDDDDNAWLNSGGVELVQFAYDTITSVPSDLRAIQYHSEHYEPRIACTPYVLRVDPIKRIIKRCGEKGVNLLVEGTANRFTSEVLFTGQADLVFGGQILGDPLNRQLQFRWFCPDQLVLVSNYEITRRNRSDVELLSHEASNFLYPMSSIFTDLLRQTAPCLERKSARHFRSMQIGLDYLMATGNQHCMVLPRSMLPADPGFLRLPIELPELSEKLRIGCFNRRDWLDRLPDPHPLRTLNAIIEEQSPNPG